MSGKSAKGLAKPAEGQEMTNSTFINEAAGYLEEIAQDYIGQPKKTLHWLVGRRVGLIERRVRAYANGEVRQVTAEEFERIKKIAIAQRKERIENLRREVARLEAKYEKDREAFRKDHPALVRLVPTTGSSGVPQMPPLARGKD